MPAGTLQVQNPYHLGVIGEAPTSDRLQMGGLQKQS